MYYSPTPSFISHSTYEEETEGIEKREGELRGEAVLLTRSGLAQWPFRAVETLPMIKSFICWVASGLSLGEVKTQRHVIHF